MNMKEREHLVLSGLDGRIIWRCQYVMKDVHSMRETSGAVRYNIIPSNLLYYFK